MSIKLIMFSRFTLIYQLLLTFKCFEYGWIKIDIFCLLIFYRTCETFLSDTCQTLKIKMCQTNHNTERKNKKIKQEFIFEYLKSVLDEKLISKGDFKI